MTHGNEPSNPTARIKVIGIGGGGTNAVSTMIRDGIEGVDFICANTDIQSLRLALAPSKIQLGKDLTKGLGAGADPDIGRDAALEDRQAIHESLAGADMVFITAGMGGGTGTGGAAIAAQIAKDSGALTVGVVTKPFVFEGKKRARHAEIGVERLRECVDTLIVVPNQRLLQIAAPDLTLVHAFRLADGVLVNAVRGISDIINIPGTINVDFADVKTVMSCTGQALMGIGVANGKDRATESAQQAISSPLLEDVAINGATGILINITAGEDVSLLEISEACSVIQEAAHPDANIIFGTVVDPNLREEIRVTVIATGFAGEAPAERPRPGATRISHPPRTQALAEEPPPPSVAAPPVLTATPRDEPSSEEEELAMWTLKARETAVPEAQPQVEVPEPVPAPPPAAMAAPEPTFGEGPVIEKDEIDKKIDEALELAEKIKQDGGREDNLEIPAFLRNGVKDLPLN